jgi:CRISPR/Cas system-associated exonuclease Cas4 (RecB family)
MSQLRISAKDLGLFALPGFCPRCLWIRLHTKNKLPYQIFPGIFSSIDSYTKKYVCSYFERYGKFPDWLASEAEFIDLIKGTHHSNFNILDQNTGILLTGVPDEIFVLKDRSYFILDYKTSRYTEAQDSLLPLYEVQLNAYAYIAERNRLSPVKKIALAYMEPQTALTEENVEKVKTENGFYMPFSGKILQLNLKPEIISQYLSEARELYNQPSPPNSKKECKDCLLLNNLFEMLNAKQDENA